EGKVVCDCALTVPIDDDAVDSPTDHVHYLALHLRRIVGGVADIHVVAKSKPGHEMRVDLCGRTCIEQAAGKYLADVGGTHIAVGLGDESIGGAGIVRSLCR